MEDAHDNLHVKRSNPQLELTAGCRANEPEASLFQHIKKQLQRKLKKKNNISLIFRFTMANGESIRDNNKIIR